MLSERAKKLLADLDVCLVEEKLSTASDLWAVLTALRGPDGINSFSTADPSDVYYVKPATTGIIRQIVFPRSSNAGITGVSREDTDRSVDIRRQIGASGHFLSHARSAFEALGLKWDEWNKG